MSGEKHSHFDVSDSTWTNFLTNSGSYGNRQNEYDRERERARQAERKRARQEARERHKQERQLERARQEALAKERKAQREALARIEKTTNTLHGLRERTQALVKELPDGVQRSFPTEIQQSNRWCVQPVPTPTRGMDSTGLNNLAQTLYSLQEEGKEVLHVLIEVKDVHRDAKARELLSQLELLRSELAGIEILLKRWRPDELITLNRFLQELPDLIEKGAFIDVNLRLQQANTQLQVLGKEATELQQQDEKRHYVLDALREVCHEMGWSEERAPVLEDPHQPGSALLYEVDTYVAGTMVFRLTLQGINVNSPLSREANACFHDFGTISEKLKEFGVMTKFENVGPGDDLPELRAKGELDIPDEGTSQEMAR